MTANTVNLSDLITLFYDEYLALYGDEELASVAAAATINDILADRTESEISDLSEADMEDAVYDLDYDRDFDYDFVYVYDYDCG